MDEPTEPARRANESLRQFVAALESGEFTIDDFDPEKIARLRSIVAVRRAGLSPIARTEIERVRDEMRQTQGVSQRWEWATAAARWAAALDSVLGAESTKEAGNG